MSLTKDKDMRDTVSGYDLAEKVFELTRDRFGPITLQFRSQNNMFCQLNLIRATNIKISSKSVQLQ